MEITQAIEHLIRVIRIALIVLPTVTVVGIVLLAYLTGRRPT